MAEMQPIPEKLAKEQAAFDELLPSILEEHRGQFVVVHHGEPIDFFKSYGDAYQAGLDRLGVDEIYLVSKVQEKKAEPASLSWELGLLA